MKQIRVTLAALAVAVVASAATPAMAGDKFVPKGHSYSPDNQSIPSLNSQQDYINNRADVYETEIYWKRRERAYWDSWMNSTHGTNLDPASPLVPNY